MRYQPLLDASFPYFVRESHLISFSAHCHHELEILHCLKGSFEAVINGKSYRLFPGDTVLIESMAVHEICDGTEDAQILVVEFGPLLLKDAFAHLARTKFTKPYIPEASAHKAPYSVFTKILKDILCFSGRRTAADELNIIGKIYQLAAYILETFGNSENATQSVNSLQIGSALALIYEQYRFPITVEEAARVSGYSKSNFCRNFKMITGKSFHEYLTRYRILNSYYYLRNTDYAIATIAEYVGFTDTRSFCRTFKNMTGMTATEYRKSNGPD